MKYLIYAAVVVYIIAVVIICLPRQYNRLTVGHMVSTTVVVTDDEYSEQVAQVASTTDMTPSVRAKIAPRSDVQTKDDISTRRKKMALKIAEYFPEEPVTMVAIAIEESQLNPNATGYNCKYFNKKGEPYTWACKPEDRNKAVSTDGNVLQENGIKGGGNIDTHLVQVRKLYDNGGKNRWTAYRTGAYKKHLNEAQSLLTIELAMK